MRCTISYPGVMEHTQQAALALLEAGMLENFVTNFVYRETGSLSALLHLLPAGAARKLSGELRRRSVDPIFGDTVRSYPGWEILRTLASKAGAGPIWTDRIWDAGARRFDNTVAQHHVPRSDAVVAFEYTALASFQRARALGKARILHMPSLDSLAFKRIEDREKAEWPELRRPEDRYFEAKFARRYERRQQEIALADLVIANSSLTKASHVAAGADPNKIIIVPLGAPPVIEAPPEKKVPNAPLRVLWSGVLSLRKGAYYMLEGWRSLNSGSHALLDVYGEIGIPEKMLRNAPDGVRFHGSIPRARMMEVYAQADVMVFPTLSDGFGMSVTEALSRGVPVITSDQAGAADFIRSGENGLIIPAANAEAIHRALQWCLDNRAALAEMKAPALETARSHQWSDYRRSVMAAMRDGLRNTGYSFSGDAA